LTYRTLHIGLLVVLLGLDAVMINLSGIGAFWLRCKTAVFEAPALSSTDLTQDTTPVFGVATTGRYRIGADSDWQSIGASITRAKHSNPILEVELGANCRIDDVRWSVFTDGLEGSRASMMTETGGTVDGLVINQSGQALRLSEFPTAARSFRISLDGSDIDVGGFTIRGANLSVPSLFQQPEVIVPEQPYWYLLVVWNVAALFGLILSGAYRITRSLELLDDLCLALKAVGIAAVTVVVILFLYRGYQEVTYFGFEFSRIVVILGAVFSTVLLTINRAIVDAIHAAFLKRGVGIRKVVVVGAGPLGQGIVSRLRKHYWLAYDPVAFVDDNPATQGTYVEGLQVMGSTESLPTVTRAVGTNEVIVALPNSSHKSIRDIVGRCQAENLRFHILPDLFEVISGDVRVGAIDGVPVLDLDDQYLGQWDRFLKRALDAGCVLVGGAILSPFLGLVSLLIKLGSKGPVLFTQPRVGENGKTFACYKFRTMHVISEAEEKREREGAYAGLIQGGEGAGKIVNRERVTWLGTFLRKYRLDELPQLLNVLRGEMSLVGPRPPIPYEIEHYNSWHMERLKGKPGITGLWQVSGGPLLSFEEMVKLDLYYLKNWSLWLDFKILLKTIPVVLSGHGA
jgi:exopolysaccharide biosynthesis polyprenyl glycosylphosphotransferase